MGNQLIITLQKQTDVLLKNILVTLESCNDEIINKPSTNWPIWKQFYHLLHSIDEWFFNPLTFIEPPFHQPYFRTSDIGPDKLSKQQLLDYFQTIKTKVSDYLQNITIELLEEIIEKINLTRFDLMLIQFRHIMHHIGYLHCTIKNEIGNSPPYIGYTKSW